MEENKMALEHAPFSFMSTIEDSVDIVSFDAEKKGLELITVTTDPEDSDNINRCYPLPDMILGDSRRLRQILVNLLGNAVKFSSKGEVVVTVTCVGRKRRIQTTKAGEEFNGEECELLFSVKDEGIGIHKLARSNIFQPFTQADTSMTRKYVSNQYNISNNCFFS